MNKGGTIDFTYCQVTMVAADHTSSCFNPEGEIESGGAPCGFIITIPHISARIYHMGDTNITKNMAIINELYKPNILLIPIGDRFTMGPKEAALACKTFFPRANYIVPMHYDTIPLLTGTFEEFKAELERLGVLGKHVTLIDTSTIKDTVKDTWVVDIAELRELHEMIEKLPDMLNLTKYKEDMYDILGEYSLMTNQEWKRPDANADDVPTDDELDLEVLDEENDPYAYNVKREYDDEDLFEYVYDAKTNRWVPEDECPEG